MERESFEDEQVAELLNQHFVSIKVDREERPDVDHLYMTVCQAMTGHGGWPLTILMTPEKKPFYAGTYFPKEKKFGRIGLMEVLTQIARKWKVDQEQIQEISEQVVQDTKSRAVYHLKGELSEDLLDKAFHAYDEVFDAAYGGFGSAPKFPTSHNLSYLLAYHKKTGNPRALEMVEKTLDSMYRGGLYDHIGYGFTRYSTDEQWLVPHFEKMLYDNALLAITYLEAFQVTHKPLYASIAEQIFTYVLRDMTDEEGGFYSAEDADSEGVEGKFYVWTPDEIYEVLGHENGKVYCQLYDITEKGNFEEHNIPNLLNGIPDQDPRLEDWRKQLFDAREARIHPHKDDKVLTSWNGLMIAALAKGAQVLQKPELIEAAEKAIHFIMNRLVREDGRLLARYRDGEAKYEGYIDDYAFLVWGLLELYEATFEPEYIELALELNEEMLTLFWDEEQGGCFFYGNDSEQLITRMKEIYDGAQPSGNSVASNNLLKLSRITGSDELMKKAEQQLQAFAGAVTRYPSGHAMLLLAIQSAYGQSREIVICGSQDDPNTVHMLRKVQQSYTPGTLILFNATGEEGEKLRDLIPSLEDKVMIENQATAYICENFACQAPVNTVEALIQQI